MRKNVVLAVASALTVAVGAAGVAEAVQSRQTISIKVLSSKAGTKAKPRSVGRLNVDLGVIVNPADAPFATRTTTIFFDKNLVFNSSKFPGCTEVQVRSGSAKCRAAKVGSGSATGDATSLDAATGQKVAFPRENLTVTAYNGPGGRTINLLVKGSAPLAINSVLVGRLQPATGKFGRKLVVTIPANLQQPLTNVFATLSSFKTSVGGTFRRVPYIALKGCTAGKLQFKGDFVFTDGSRQSPTSTSTCRK